MGLTLISITSLFTIFPFLFVVLLVLNNYRKYRYRHLLYFLIGWSSFLLWAVCMLLAELLLSIPIKIIGVYFMIIGGFALMISLELITRDTITSPIVIIFSILSTFLIRESLAENSQTIGYRGNGEISVISSGLFRIYYSVTILAIGILFFVYMSLIFYHAPKRLKKGALLNFLGASIVGLLTPLIYFGNLSVVLPGSTNFFLAIGVLLSTIAFIKYPQLAFILPFKTFRLIIINTQNGIPLYNHSWLKSDHEFEDHIFSGFLHAASGILNATISQGEVREIQLDRAVMLIQRLKEIPIACVLVASKSSRTLRLALIEFTKNFYNKYRNIPFDRGDITQLSSIGQLISQDFAFIPIY